jgi:hypothetical protein
VSVPYYFLAVLLIMGHCRCVVSVWSNPLALRGYSVPWSGGLSPACHHGGPGPILVSPSEVCSRRSGFGSVFSSECLIFPCQYHSSTDTYSSVSPVDRTSSSRMKGGLPTSSVLSRKKRGALNEKVPHFLYVLL